MNTMHTTDVNGKQVRLTSCQDGSVKLQIMRGQRWTHICDFANMTKALDFINGIKAVA